MIVDFIKIPTEQMSECHRCSKGITSADRVCNFRGHAFVLGPATIREQKTAVCATGQSHEPKGITLSEFSELCPNVAGELEEVYMAWVEE